MSILNIFGILKVWPMAKVVINHQNVLKSCNLHFVSVIFKLYFLKKNSHLLNGLPCYSIHLTTPKYNDLYDWLSMLKDEIMINTCKNFAKQRNKTLGWYFCFCFWTSSKRSVFLDIHLMRNVFKAQFLFNYL